MFGTFTFSFARVTALFAASLLILASSALGAFYGFSAGNRVHMALGIVLAAAAIAGEMLKPISVAAAFDAFAETSYGRMLAAIALASVCLVYSAAAELNFAATVRGDQVAERTAKASTDGGARKRAEAELLSLAPARPAAELAPLVDAKRAITRGADCATWNAAAKIRNACEELALLTSELGRATRRGELENALRDGLDHTGPAIGAADPLAAAIANYGNTFGKDWTAETISPWLALIPVAFLEIASALALVVARSIPAGATPVNAKAAPRPAVEAPAPEHEAGAPDVPPALPQPSAASLEARALETHVETVKRLLDVNSGRLTGSQRKLAQLAGLPKTSFGRAVRALQAAGAVRVRVETDGTIVERVAA